MTARIRLLSLLGVLLLQGCGTMADPTTWFGQEDPATIPAELEAIAEQFKPQELWSENTDGSELEQAGLRPAVQSGVLYVADGEGNIAALSADSGATQWEMETELPITAGPGVGEGLLAVGTSEGEVVVFGASDGAERWRTFVTSEILAVPAVGADRVVVHSLDGRLFALNAADGTTVWRYDRDIPVLTLRGSSSPVIVADKVYVGLENGKVVALDLATGEADWEATVATAVGRTDLERMTDIDSDPLYYAGALYVASFQGKVMALGEASGKPFWTRDLASYANMAANYRQLAVVDADSRVWALDPDTGAAKWRQEALLHRRLSGPAIQGGYIVVGDFEGYLHWLSPDDGSMVARSRVGSGPIAAPLKVVNEVLYVYGADGSLAAVTLPAQP